MIPMDRTLLATVIALVGLATTIVSLALAVIVTSRTPFFYDLAHAIGMGLLVQIHLAVLALLILPQQEGWL